MKIILMTELAVIIVILLVAFFFQSNETSHRLKEITASGGNNTRFVPNKNEKRKLNFSFLPQSLRKTIEGSDINIRVEEFVLIWVSLTVIPALIWNVFTGNLLQSSIVAVIGAIIPPLYINMVNNSRKNKFAVQLGDALLLLSNSLRSGFSFEQALAAVAENMPDPVSKEFMTVQKELNVGISLEQSLTSLGERMSNSDITLLTSAVLIQRQVGGNLANIIDTISKTIQDRIKMKNHIKTLTAQGKISGLLIGGLPVMLFIVISMINPDYMSIMYETTFGKIATGLAILLEFSGFMVIRKMINI